MQPISGQARGDRMLVLTGDRRAASESEMGFSAQQRKAQKSDAAGRGWPAGESQHVDARWQRLVVRDYRNRVFCESKFRSEMSTPGGVGIEIANRTMRDRFICSERRGSLRYGWLAATRTTMMMMRSSLGWWLNTAMLAADIIGGAVTVPGWAGAGRYAVAHQQTDGY